MSNVLMAKLSPFGKMKGDDLAIITLQNVMNVKSSHFFSQTLPQTQSQTQPKKKNPTQIDHSLSLFVSCYKIHCLAQAFIYIIRSSTRTDYYQIIV